MQTDLNSKTVIINPLNLVAQWTRWLQMKNQNKPIKGLRRFANWLSDILPHYEGAICLPKDVKMWLDSDIDQERYLLFMGDYQPPLTEFLFQHTPRGAYCLDVGANIGYYTMLFSRWTGLSGRVAAFEANTHIIPRIERNVRLNQYSNIDIVCKAVHHEITTLEFYISKHPGTSSIYEHHVSDRIEVARVDTITIDAYITAQGWERLDIIKIDIEGNDCFAILGGAETIKRFRPTIVFEYWPADADVIRRTKALFDALDYRLECLLWDGERLPFDWVVPNGNKHVDVLCSPL